MEKGRDRKSEEEMEIGEEEERGSEGGKRSEGRETVREGGGGQTDKGGS